jgi:hypothetical protein
MAIAAGTPNYGDARLLLQAAENLFIGKAMGKTGHRDMRRGFMPGVQFSVEVEENVKGSLVGSVIFSQEGGEDVWIEDHAPLVEVGSSYLLATRYKPDEGWHVVAEQPWGVVRIEDDRHRRTLLNDVEAARKGLWFYLPPTTLRFI